MADWLSLLNKPPVNPLINFGGWGDTSTSVPTMSAASMGLGGMPMNPLTGSPDYLASLQSPALTGIDLGVGMPNQGGWGAGLSDLFSSKSMFGGVDLNSGMKTPGWAGTALGVGQGLMNGWMGLKNLGLARDTLDQSKKQFDLNFGAQSKLTNSHLEDRQRARVASNPGAYQPIGEYMKKNGV